MSQLARVPQKVRDVYIDQAAIVAETVSLAAMITKLSSTQITDRPLHCLPVSIWFRLSQVEISAQTQFLCLALGKNCQ